MLFANFIEYERYETGKGELAEKKKVRIFAT
jgi:hypothetical protein